MNFRAQSRVHLPFSPQSICSPLQHQIMYDESHLLLSLNHTWQETRPGGLRLIASTSQYTPTVLAL